MPDIKYASVMITELFMPKNGSGLYTKKYCYEHKGNYEVFSGTSNGVFAYVDDYEYEGEYLTWVKDGFAGKVRKLSGKFSITNHRGILVPTEKCTNICYDYIEYILEPIFRRHRKGRVGHDGENEYTTLNETMIYEIEEPLVIPVNDRGIYDIEIQRELANRFRNIAEKRRNILKTKLELENTYVTLKDDETGYAFASFRLDRLYLPKRGNGKYTKTYCHLNNGNYPVYSANNNAPLAYSNFFDYDGNFLTISVNGIAGRITEKSGKFSINADRIILIPQVDNLDNDYIKYTLEPKLRKMIKGRIGHDGENEFTKLPSGNIESVCIDVPIDEYGLPDINKQIAIARRYKTIDQVKLGICKKLQEVADVEVVLSSANT